MPGTSRCRDAESGSRSWNRPGLPSVWGCISSPHELNPELPDAVNTVDKIRRDMQKCGSSMERLLFSEVGDASAKELTGIALDSMKCQIDEMEQLLAFCGKNRGGR